MKEFTKRLRETERKGRKRTVKEKSVCVGGGKEKDHRGMRKMEAKKWKRLEENR